MGFLVRKRESLKPLLMVNFGGLLVCIEKETVMMFPEMSGLIP